MTADKSDPHLSREAAVDGTVETSNENALSAVAEGSSGADAKGKSPASEQPTVGSSSGSASTSASASNSLGSNMTPEMAQRVLSMNPALKTEFAGVEPGKALERLRSMTMEQLMSGMTIGGKAPKDQAAYKFWSTQPVPRFDETLKDQPDGVIKAIEIEQVPKQPNQLPDGFEWVVIDLEDEKELTAVHELLSFNYVEDQEEMFRLNYASSFLNWALKSPGWKKEWHIGVRASKSRKLVAFISAVPCKLRVRGNVLDCAEVNFLVVHKKLRSKQLAPVMIKEITRQCYLKGIFQACYTAGQMLPTPVSSCRYYHRSIQWQKLYECRFAGLPTGSTVARQVAKNKLPDRTSTKGLRETTKADVPAVTDLLGRYLKKFVLAPEFSEEEVSHWMVHDPSSSEQVTWSYVVEEPSSKKITDFVSFYLLESKVIGNHQHNSIRAAYLFYYATEAAFSDDKTALKTRLNALMQDTLILAKKAKFDVVNGLTLLDNPLFLEQQKFQAGDGQLHYYLYNYRTAAISGGTNEKNLPDETRMGGIGLVML